MSAVVITTSGTGSRLYSYTKYTNKALIKVGDKYAICHIIEKYPISTRFIITLGYYGKFVRDFISLAYPDYNIKYIEVDCYEGPGSSLGYSLYCARELLQEPFIFHCCDTILAENIDIAEINVLGTNTAFVTRDPNYMTYSSITINDSLIKTFHPKGYSNNDYIYIGILYISDYALFWNILDDIIKQHPCDTSLSDINVISKMIESGKIFTYKVIDEFYDTGNIESYMKACNNFKSRYNILEKNDESLCFLGTKVIKFFYNDDINIKRVKRGQNLYPLVPKIIAYKDNYMVMEYINGDLLSEYRSYGEIYKLLNWAKTNLWVNPINNSNYIDRCKNFYYTKTINRIKSLPFLDKEMHTINGLNIGSMGLLLDKVIFTDLYTDTFYKFHGDFILDNIMKVKNAFILLDWRQDFDNELYHGDMYYDLAKLRHNIIFNHKNITDKLFSIEEINNNIYIDLKCNYNLIKQLEDYNKFITENSYNMKKIEILTAVIWLNMSPLYSGDLSKFLYYFGKLNLYLAIN